MGERLRLHRTHRAAPPETKTAWSHQLCAAITEAGYPIRPVRELPDRPGEWVAEPDLSTIPDEVWNKAITLLAARYDLELADPSKTNEDFRQLPSKAQRAS